MLQPIYPPKMSNLNPLVLKRKVHRRVRLLNRPSAMPWLDTLALLLDVIKFM